MSTNSLIGLMTYMIPFTALAIVTALGALDETIQSFFAYRQADLLDLLADISAAGATVISLNIGSAAFGSFRAVTKS